MPNVATFVSAGDGAAIPAGVVGENNIVFGSGSSAPAASGTGLNLISTALSAGVWLVQGLCRFDKNSSNATLVQAGISDTSATAQTGHTTVLTPNSGAATMIPTPMRIFVKTGSWTAYVVGIATYTTISDSAFDLSTCNVRYVRIA